MDFLKVHGSWLFIQINPWVLQDTCVRGGHRRVRVKERGVPVWRAGQMGHTLDATDASTGAKSQLSGPRFKWLSIAQPPES